MKIHHICLGITAVFLGLSAAGCTGFRWGFGNDGVFKSGSLIVGVDARPDQVIGASEKAFRGLQWDVLTSSRSYTDGHAYARTGEGKDVRVNVRLSGGHRSTVTLHVGTLGDEGASRLLLAHLRAHLGLEGPQSPWWRRP